MPVIKRVSEQSVRPTGLQVAPNNVQQRPLETNSAISQGASNVAASLEKIGQRVNETKLTEAESALYQRADDLLYNSDDAYYKREGQNAFESVGEIQERLEKVKQQVADEYLTNDQQRQMFEQIAQRRLRTDQKNISVHAERELDVWDQAASEARMNSAVESARADYSTDSITTNVVRLQDEINSQARKGGWSPDQRMNTLRNKTSDLITASITQAIKNDETDRAEELMSQYSDDINENDKATLKSKLEQVNQAKEAMSMADSIRQNGGSRAERLDQVYQIDDPEIRKEVRSQVLADLQQEELIEAEQESDAYERAVEMTEAGVPLDYMKRQPQWNIMSVRQRDDIRKRIQNKYAGNDETDFAAYDKLRGLLEDGKRHEAHVYFLKNRHRFSEKYKRKFSDETQEQGERDQDFFSAMDYVKGQIDDLDVQEQSEFKYHFENWYDKYQDRNDGKAPGLGEIKEKTDAMLEEKATGMFSGDYAFKVDLKQREDAINKATTVFEDEWGTPPNELETQALDTILKNYHRKHGRFPPKNYLREKMIEAKNKSEANAGQ